MANGPVSNKNSLTSSSSTGDQVEEEDPNLTYPVTVKSAHLVLSCLQVLFLPVYG